MGIKGVISSNKGNALSISSRPTSTLPASSRPAPPDSDVVGYTKAKLPEKVTYTGVASESALVSIDNNPESSTFGQIRVDVNATPLLQNIQAKDASTSVTSDSEGNRLVGVNISQDKNNLLELKSDGLFANAPDLSSFATIDQLEAGLETKQDVLTAGENISIVKDGQGRTIISSIDTGYEDYNELINKPVVNGVTLEGEVSLTDLSIATKVSQLENDVPYVDETTLEEALEKEQDKLTPGEGIAITTDSEGNVIISNTKASAEWGKIQGTLSNQHDLQAALDGKQDQLVQGMNITLEPDGEGHTVISASSGTIDYEHLENKPQINSVELIGNKSFSDLGIKTSVITNDSGFVSGDWVNEQVAAHNANAMAHSDIRNALVQEADTRATTDADLQEQIDALTSASDVIDILGTYAELQAYPTAHLRQNDIIKVLQDETRSNAVTYYRWNISSEGEGAWVYIGEQGPYYTSAQIDANFVPNTRTINDKALNQNLNLTYTDVGALPATTVIGDGQVVIKKNNSTEAGRFNLNQTGNAEINLQVPSQVSDLEGYSNLALKTELPTKTSELSNDSGYVTAANVTTQIADNNSNYVDQGLATKQDVLTAGTGITILPDGQGHTVISSTGTAGIWGNIIGTLADQTDLQAALDAKQPLITSAAPLSASLVDGLANVATTGSYADLSNKPSINGVTLSGNKTTDDLGITEGTVVRLIRWS